MSRSSNWQLCWFALTLVIVSTQTVVADDLPNDLAGIQRQIQTGWEHLKKLDEDLKTYDVLQVVKTTQSRPELNLKEATVRTQVSVDWPNVFRRLHMVNDDAKSPPLLYGRNPDYAFILAKTGSGWRLQAYNHAKPKSNPIDHEILDSVPIRDILYPLSCSFYGMALQTDLLKDKDFQLTDFKKMADDRVSVHFTFKYILPGDEKRFATFEGDMLVNPSLFWAVEEWSYTGGNGSSATMTRSVKHAQDAPDIILCRSITKQGPIQRLSFDYENYSFSEAPLDAFRLSYYGLPEPSAAPKSTNWFFRLTLVAFGVLGLALVCWMIARRTRSKTLYPV